MLNFIYLYVFLIYLECFNKKNWNLPLDTRNNHHLGLLLVKKELFIY